MKKTITAIIVLLLMSVQLLHAKHGKYSTYGHGAGSCGEWSESRNQGYFSFPAWLLGWVSAAGYYSVELPESDSRALRSWMDNYCNTNPLDKVSDGAKKLVKELERRHLQE